MAAVGIPVTPGAAPRACVESGAVCPHRTAAPAGSVTAGRTSSSGTTRPPSTRAARTGRNGCRSPPTEPMSPVGQDLSPIRSLIRATPPDAFHVVFDGRPPAARQQPDRPHRRVRPKGPSRPGQAGRVLSVVHRQSRLFLVPGRTTMCLFTRPAPRRAPMSRLRRPHTHRSCRALRPHAAGCSPQPGLARHGSCRIRLVRTPGTHVGEP